MIYRLLVFPLVLLQDVSPFIDFARINNQISYNHALLMYKCPFYSRNKLTRSLLCLVSQGEGGFDDLKVDQFHRHKSPSAF